MARGDRREAIVRDDEDRGTWVRTPGEACERARFVVHTYVLMTNHYHLLLETPEGNLSRGMAWLQNTYTRRINTRHRLWGHVFGGRYKSIVVEPGNCFWALLDYLHLNPVRAGLVREADGWESYGWSSLKGYLSLPKARPKWLRTEVGMEVCGCPDTARGRREFLEVLERRVDWRHQAKAGAVYSPEEGKPELAVHSTLRRGWLFGSQEFREKLLKLAAGKIEDRSRIRADGYQGEVVRDHGEWRAGCLLKAGRKHFALEAEELRSVRKNDWRKAVMAELIQEETTVRLNWIADRLAMGTRSGCCRLIRKTREGLRKKPGWRKARAVIQKDVNIT